MAPFDRKFNSRSLDALYPYLNCIVFKLCLCLSLWHFDITNIDLKFRLYEKWQLVFYFSAYLIKYHDYNINVLFTMKLKKKILPEVEVLL